MVLLQNTVARRMVLVVLLAVSLLTGLILTGASPSVVLAQPPAAGCAAGTYDMLDYIFNDNPVLAAQANLFNLDGTPRGGVGSQQTTYFRAYDTSALRADSRFYIAKQFPAFSGRAAEYEEYRYDASYIYLMRDTSWQAPNWSKDAAGIERSTMFELWSYTPNAYGAVSQLGGQRFPRCVQLGTSYSFPSSFVARFEGGPPGPEVASANEQCKVAPNPNNNFNGGNYSRFKAAHLASYTFPHSGRTITDVLRLDLTTADGTVFEKYYYSRTEGWVGYEDVLLPGQNAADKILAEYIGPANGGNPFEIGVIDYCATTPIYIQTQSSGQPYYAQNNPLKLADNIASEYDFAVIHYSTSPVTVTLGYRQPVTTLGFTSTIGGYHNIPQGNRWTAGASNVLNGAYSTISFSGGQGTQAYTDAGNISLNFSTQITGKFLRITTKRLNGDQAVHISELVSTINSSPIAMP